MQKFFTTLLLSALLLTACSSTPAATTPASPSAQPPTTRPTTPPATALSPAPDPAAAITKASIKRSPEATPATTSGFFFLDQQRGWLARGNHLLTTTDGGQHWQQIGKIQQSAILGVSFVSPERGFIGTEHGLLTTPDGGTTWQRVDAAGNESVWQVIFVDAQHGWLPGTKSFRRTADGGQTWTELQNAPCTAGPFAAISPTHAWLLCTANFTRQGESRQLYTTTDGGATWQRLAVTDAGTPQGRGHAVHLSFVDDTQGWLALSGGPLLRTVDGGRTWQQVRAFTGAAPLSLQFFTPQVGYQLLENDGGTVVATHDGGATWSAVYPALRPTTGSPRVFFDNAHGIGGYTAADSGQIVATVDGGRTWQAKGRIDGMNLIELSFVDSLHGWAAGQMWNEGVKWAVYATADGGATWTRLVQAPASNEATTSTHIARIDLNTGFVTGDQGQLYVTHDGGASFAPVGKPEPWRQGMHFVTAQHGWETVSYKLLETTDGGVSWQLVPLPGWMWPEYVQVLSDGRLVMAAMHEPDTNSGGVYFSRDDGRTWTGFDADQVPAPVCFAPDGVHGWIMSGLQQFYTADGGRTWEELP